MSQSEDKLITEFFKGVALGLALALIPGAWAWGKGIDMGRAQQCEEFGGARFEGKCIRRDSLRELKP